jgi:hypothetical protein
MPKTSTTPRQRLDNAPPHSRAPPHPPCARANGHEKPKGVVVRVRACKAGKEPAPIVVGAEDCRLDEQGDAEFWDFEVGDLVCWWCFMLSCWEPWDPLPFVERRG